MQKNSSHSEETNQLYDSVPEVREALADPVLYFLVHSVQPALRLCLLLLHNLLQLCLIH